MVDKVESHYAGGGDVARAITESLSRAGKDIQQADDSRSGNAR